MSVAPTSIAAFKTTPLAPMRDRVYDVIESYGEHGCISDEVFTYFATITNTNTGRITGRYSELENDGRMIRLGDTRIGISGKQQLVMRATKFTPKAVKASKKVNKTGFLAGLMFAARILVAAESLASAKANLKRELIKAAKR